MNGATINAHRIADPFATNLTPNSTNPTAVCPTKVHTVQNWYNPCAFANPQTDNIGYTTAFYPGTKQLIPNTVTGQAAYAYVGDNRGQTRGPGYERVDASLFKSFATFREQNLQIRADIFNVLNTPSYGNPGTTNISSTGGQITGARFFQANTPDSRFFQFAAKYIF